MLKKIFFNLIILLNIICNFSNLCLAESQNDNSLIKLNTDSIETLNPIKLSIEANEPSYDLPILSGPISLKKAIDEALNNNLNLKISKATNLESAYLIRSAIAQFGPSASFNTWYSNSSISQMLFYPSSLAVTPETMQPIARGQSLALIMVGSQPIFTGGRLMGNYKAAKAKKIETLAQLNADKIDITLKVIENYWLTAYNQAKLTVDLEYARLREMSCINLKNRYLDGKNPKADYLREEAELAKAKRSINNDYQAYNISLLTLKEIIGLNLGSPITISDSLEYTENNETLNSYLLKAKIFRPELSGAQAYIKETDANKMVRKSSYLPQLSLYGGSSNITGSSPDGNERGHWGGFLGVMGGITVFDSGYRKNQLKISSIEITKAQTNYKVIELKIAKEVSKAWIELETAKNNVKLIHDEIISAKEDARLFHERYLIGKSIALEDFDAKVKLYQAKLSLYQAIYEYLVSLARLKAASGKI